MPVPSASPFIITSAPYATSVSLYLKTWPKWLRVLSLALASTMLTMFYLETLRKKHLQTSKSREPLCPCRWPSVSILQFTYSPPAASHPLKSGTLSLYLRTCTSRHLKTNYCLQPFQPTYPLSFCSQIRLLLTIVYFACLFTCAVWQSRVRMVCLGVHTATASRYQPVTATQSLVTARTTT